MDVGRALFMRALFGWWVEVREGAVWVVWERGRSCAIKHKTHAKFIFLFLICVVALIRAFWF